VILGSQLIYVREDTCSISNGTGTFALETSRTGVRVLGVDLSDEMIEFPDTQEVVSGINPLFPIKCDSLRKVLKETGWEVSGQWGNFDKDAWTEDSPATVLEAKRMLGKLG